MCRKKLIFSFYVAFLIRIDGLNTARVAIRGSDVFRMWRFLVRLRRREIVLSSIQLAKWLAVLVAALLASVAQAQDSPNRKEMKRTDPSGTKMKSFSPSPDASQADDRAPHPSRRGSLLRARSRDRRDAHATAQGTVLAHSDRMLGGLFLTACQIGSLDTWFRLRDPFLDRSIAPRVPPR